MAQGEHLPLVHGELMERITPPDKEVFHEVTRLLKGAGGGQARAAESLLPLVYEELRKLAAHRMTAKRSDHTLPATTLVHEAYIRLVADRDYRWANRAQFFVAAVEAMRRILIEHARAKKVPRRGGDLQRLPVNIIDLATTDDPKQFLVLDDAVSRLEQEDADAACVVRLRFYCYTGSPNSRQPGLIADHR
jgi:RNA polymerase sigma factor (TIGR02999 family)